MDHDTPIDAPTSDERLYALIMHPGGLAPYVTVIAGPLGFLVPLVMWLIKKDESRFIDANGREAVNFQLTILILAIVGVLLVLFTLGIGIIVVIPAALALVVVDIVFCILAAMAANRGEVYRYPFAFRVIGPPRVA